MIYFIQERLVVKVKGCFLSDSAEFVCGVKCLLLLLLLDIQKPT